MSDPTIPAVDPTAPTPATIAAELQEAASQVDQLEAQKTVVVDPARPLLAELVALLDAKYQGLGSDLNALLARAKAVLAA